MEVYGNWNDEQVLPNITVHGSFISIGHRTELLFRATDGVTEYIMIYQALSFTFENM